MRFLLDTNVISEWVKPRPERRVVAWLDAADQDCLYLSVLAFAEVRLGIERLPAGAKRNRLTVWLDHDLAAWFEGRIIGIDLAIARAWAQLVARGRSVGRTPPILDAFMVATALVHGMTLVTRDRGAAAGLEAPVFNPWEG
ncbi:MAG: type II toxin-antitoxin system VapC family toxin [Geminicoccales bacterium]